MSFGVYIHIPYCIQRCRYCDFTTFEQNKILPPKDYVEYVKKEIRLRSRFAPKKQIDSIYFGGGTPSLIEADLIAAILQELRSEGFVFDGNSEVTLEINPATVDETKLNTYLENGINRFSVGAQSFNDQFLKDCGREHSARDTMATLNLLKKYNLRFTADILFALPKQNLEQVVSDTRTLLEFEPRHISAYCLTVPTGHPMSSGRAPDQQQVEMFNSIRHELGQQGVKQYEISNFAVPGFESKHNLLYWSDQPFWGIGLSSHSYLPEFSLAPQGLRFWNPKKFDEYFNSLEPKEEETFPAISDCREILQQHEAMTDYCHMFLRTMRGLSLDAARNRFPNNADLLSRRLCELSNKGLLTQEGSQFQLSEDGVVLSNKVFESLTFSVDEINA